MRARAIVVSLGAAFDCPVAISGVDGARVSWLKGLATGRFKLRFCRGFLAWPLMASSGCLSRDAERERCSCQLRFLALDESADGFRLRRMILHPQCVSRRFDSTRFDRTCSSDFTRAGLRMKYSSSPLRTPLTASARTARSAPECVCSAGDRLRRPVAGAERCSRLDPYGRGERDPIAQSDRLAPSHASRPVRSPRRPRGQKVRLSAAPARSPTRPRMRWCAAEARFSRPRLPPEAAGVCGGGSTAPTLGAGESARSARSGVLLQRPTRYA